MASPYTKSSLKDLAWYCDDERLAIVKVGSTTGEYDSIDDTLDSGNSFLQVHFHSRFVSITAITQDLEDDIGLPIGLHLAVVDYVKARLYEDMGDLQRSQYFLAKYLSKVKKYPYRRTSRRGINPYAL